MYREKITRCPLYPVMICFIASDDGDVVNKKRSLGLDKDLVAHTVAGGMEVDGEEDESICVYLVFNPYFKHDIHKFGPGLVAHECFHGTGFILDRVGVKSDHINSEAQAYLLEYLVDQATEFMKPFMK